MAETILINPLQVTGADPTAKPIKRRRRMARRRRTTKPKVIRVTRKATPQSVAKQVALITGGMIAAGLLNKAIKIPQKHLVSIAGSAALIMFGKKLLGVSALPIGVGMGAAGVFSWLATRPELKGMLSDYCGSHDPYDMRGFLPGQSMTGLSDYYIDPGLGGMSTRNIDFADIK